MSSTTSPSAATASLDEEGRRDQADRLLINPEPGWILNYAVMVILAALIAGLGMRLDSAPIVIGAMLVAPVMRPVLGLGFACLTAVPAVALRRLFTVLALTSVGLVAIGWLLTILIPSTEAGLAGEVLARTAPDIRDLLVALAAGAVGAFAIMRPRVGDTITGVAIAVALVPPPVAAGIALGESFGTQALGALLLYGTNLVAIVFGTVLTALALRLFGDRPFPLSKQRLQRSLAIVVVLGLGAGIPLASSFTEAVGDAQVERDRRVRQDSLERLRADARSEIRDWLDEGAQPNLEIVSVDLPDGTLDDEASLIAVVLLGESDSYIPPLEGVDDRVAEALDRPVKLGIRLVGVADQVASTFEIAASTSDDPNQDAELRQQIAESVAAWTADAGVAMRMIEIATVEPQVVLVRVAIAGPQPPIQDLHREFTDRIGEIPRYELVIEELLLPPTTLSAEPRTAPGSGAVTAVVDGRTIDELDACEVDEGTGRYLVASRDGEALAVDAGMMTVFGSDGEGVQSASVSRAEGNGSTMFTGTFDRSESGISEIVVTITPPQPEC